jgi:GT2 family glycosyltransferase
MPNPAVSVVIANLNGEKYLAGCLEALSRQTARDFEVIVVDNGSTDGSVPLIENSFPWVKVVRLDTNSGFAKGNNVGIRASHSEYVATLNNDAIVSERWLEELYRAAESDPAVGMVASKILLGREGREIDSAGMLIYPDGMTRQRGRGEADNGQYDGMTEVLFPSACAALYRRRMLDETGLFDEEFFSYCEDADLGLRGRLAGWKAVFAPHALVRHLYSVTGGSYSGFKALHVERNHFWVLLKDMPARYIMTLPLYTLWRYMVQIYGLLSGRGSVARFAENASKYRLVTVVLRAYFKALAGAPRMLRKRRKIWKGRRVCSREYLEILKRHRITASELMLRD